jgi:hypothetical protein
MPSSMLLQIFTAWPVPGPPWPDRDPRGQGVGEFLFQAHQVEILGPLGRRRRRGVGALDQMLGLAHGVAARGDLLAQADLLQRLDAEQGPCMPHVDASGHQQVLDRLRKLQQPQQIGRGAARAADGLRRLLVGEGKLGDQPLHALRLFQGVEVLALDVLDERHGQRRLIGNVLDDHRHRGEPGHLRRTKTPLSGDDLELLRGQRAHQDRLDDALLADGLGQLGQRLGVHARARLVAAGAQLGDRQLVRNALAGVFGALAAEQCVQSPAQALGAFHRVPLP